MLSQKDQKTLKGFAKIGGVIALVFALGWAIPDHKEHRRKISDCALWERISPGDDTTPFCLANKTEVHDKIKTDKKAREKEAWYAHQQQEEHYDRVRRNAAARAQWRKADEIRLLYEAAAEIEANPRRYGLR